LLADLRAGTPQFRFDPLVTPYNQKKLTLLLRNINPKYENADSVMCGAGVFR
jgi:hypothetical protein